MNNSYFKDKNVLNFVSIDNHDYWNFIYSNMEPHFKKCNKFNFIQYSREHGIAATEQYIREFIKKNDIHIVLSTFFPSDFELSFKFYQSLRKDVKLVFWFFDDESFYDVITKYYGQLADAVITTDYYPALCYKKYGVPSMYNTPIQNSKEMYPIDMKKDIDVCYIGDCTKSNRMEHLKFLENNEIQLETYGFGSKNGFTAEGSLPSIYARSRIILNFTKVDRLTWMTCDEPLLNRTWQNKAHFSQAAMTGSFCLSEYAPTINLIAEIGKEIEVFHTKEEMLEKVKYYLSHDNERTMIAQNALKKAQESFTENRSIPKTLDELAVLLTEQKNTVADIYLNKSIKKKAINGLSFSLCILLKMGKFGNAFEMFFKLFQYGLLPFVKGAPQGIIRALKVLYHMKITKEYRDVYKKI